VKRNAFELMWQDKIKVDLLPFGKIEDAHGKVTVKGAGLTSINLQGFMEVYESGLPQINLEDKHEFKFCSLPGIVILKFIAWHDRPEKRQKDIIDICNIVKHFFEMYANEIWEHHNALFIDDKLEILDISTIVLGREMKVITQRNSALQKRIDLILEENTNDSSKSPIATLMSQYFGDTIEDNIKLLNLITRGLRE
jgi:predicted nucleotidyltransferase